MKVVALSSSRADYGIYLPLFKELASDNYFDFSIIAFGTHTSRHHGYTVQNILEDGFKVSHQVESLILGDTPEAIAGAIGLTVLKFSSIWSELANDIDLILCLGDRYEMFAAVAASVPFNIKVAHIHGGETTSGAIDNSMRSCLTTMSSYHFASTSNHVKRISELTGSSENVFNVGALSLDNIQDVQLLSAEEFEIKYGINMLQPTILFTFHPETINPHNNLAHTTTLIQTLRDLLDDFNLVLTMPNADTFGSLVREKLNEFVDQFPDKVYSIENFGTKGYFSCMNLSACVLGNSSSGIIEAASFGKYVVNVGERQAGRDAGANVISVPIEKASIINAVRSIVGKRYNGKNIYYAGGAKAIITETLKSINYE